MPTGKDSDVIPVRTATKKALTDAKGDATYDEALRALLANLTPEEILAIIQARRAMDARRKEAERSAAKRTDPGREPEKQLLIARVAEIGRRRWLEEGRLVQLGPRRYRFNVGGEAPGKVPLRVRPGRGLPPRGGKKPRGL